MGGGRPGAPCLVQDHSTRLSPHAPSLLFESQPFTSSRPVRGVHAKLREACLEPCSSCEPDSSLLSGPAPAHDACTPPHRSPRRMPPHHRTVVRSSSAGREAGRRGAPQVIRQYHGHLSGIYSLALHPPWTCWSLAAATPWPASGTCAPKCRCRPHRLRRPLCPRRLSAPDGPSAPVASPPPPAPPPPFCAHPGFIHGWLDRRWIRPPRSTLLSGGPRANTQKHTLPHEVSGSLMQQAPQSIVNHSGATTAPSEDSASDNCHFHPPCDAVPSGLGVEAKRGGRAGGVRGGRGGAAQVHCLSGHDETVASILTQGSDPQVPPPPLFPSPASAPPSAAPGIPITGRGGHRTW